jgi:hypothetical protein
MSTVLEKPRPEPARSDKEWLAEAELIISALEAGAPGPAPAGAASSVEMENRRRHPRRRYLVIADLRLFSDQPGSPRWRLFTRDVSVRGVGFVTRDRLPLGYGGIIELPGPNGRLMSIQGTLFRCREIGNGWYEGALYFNREQWPFAPA